MENSAYSCYQLLFFMYGHNMRTQGEMGWPRWDALGPAMERATISRYVLSLRVGGARRSSFPWLRSRNRKRAPAPIDFARWSCSSGHRLAGLQQDLESEQLAVLAKLPLTMPLKELHFKMKGNVGYCTEIPFYYVFHSVFVTTSVWCLSFN